MIRRGRVLLCPLTPSGCSCILSLYCCILSLDGGAEGTVRRALGLLCPLPPSCCYCSILTF